MGYEEVLASGQEVVNQPLPVRACVRVCVYVCVYVCVCVFEAGLKHHLAPTIVVQLNMWIRA